MIKSTVFFLSIISSSMGITQTRKTSVGEPSNSPSNTPSLPPTTMPSLRPTPEPTFYDCKSALDRLDINNLQTITGPPDNNGRYYESIQGAQECRSLRVKRHVTFSKRAESKDIEGIPRAKRYSAYQAEHLLAGAQTYCSNGIIWGVQLKNGDYSVGCNGKKKNCELFHIGETFNYSPSSCYRSSLTVRRALFWTFSTIVLACLTCIAKLARSKLSKNRSIIKNKSIETKAKKYANLLINPLQLAIDHPYLYKFSNVTKLDKTLFMKARNAVDRRTPNYLIDLESGDGRAINDNTSSYDLTPIQDPSLDNMTFNAYGNLLTELVTLGSLGLIEQDTNNNTPSEQLNELGDLSDPNPHSDVPCLSTCDTRNLGETLSSQTDRTALKLDNENYYDCIDAGEEESKLNSPADSGEEESKLNSSIDDSLNLTNFLNSDVRFSKDEMVAFIKHVRKHAKKAYEDMPPENKIAFQKKNFNKLFQLMKNNLEKPGQNKEWINDFALFSDFEFITVEFKKELALFNLYSENLNIAKLKSQREKYIQNNEFNQQIRLQIDRLLNLTEFYIFMNEESSILVTICLHGNKPNAEELKKISKHYPNPDEAKQKINSGQQLFKQLDQEMKHMVRKALDYKIFRDNHNIDLKNIDIDHYILNFNVMDSYILDKKYWNDDDTQVLLLSQKDFFDQKKLMELHELGESPSEEKDQPNIEIFQGLQIDPSTRKLDNLLQGPKSPKWDYFLKQSTGKLVLSAFDEEQDIFHIPVHDHQFKLTQTIFGTSIFDQLSKEKNTGKTVKIHLFYNPALHNNYVKQKKKFKETTQYSACSTDQKTYLHGTSRKYALDLIHSGIDSAKQNREAYGPGFYVSQSVSEAKTYSSQSNKSVGETNNGYWIIVLKARTPSSLPGYVTEHDHNPTYWTINPTKSNPNIVALIHINR